MYIYIYIFIGNEWTLLHQQNLFYPTPTERSATLQWFQVSRNEVPWQEVHYTIILLWYDVL